MRISEYIAHLEAIRAEHGDLEVQKFSATGDRAFAPIPDVAFAKVLTGRAKAKKWQECGNFWQSTVNVQRRPLITKGLRLASPVQEYRHGGKHND